MARRGTGFNPPSVEASEPPSFQTLAELPREKTVEAVEEPRQPACPLFFIFAVGL